MKLLLFANSKVGLEVTRFLLENYLGDLSLVVTTGEDEIFHMVKDANVSVIVQNNLTQLGQADYCYDLGILAWWPNIIKAPLLSLPQMGYINCHPSLLPFNRGKHYNFWALVENAPFGVSLHFIDEGIDTGDIVYQRLIPYDWTDNGETLYCKAQQTIIELFQESYPMLRSLNITRHKQDLSQGSFHYASELKLASMIDLNKAYSGRELLNLLRARTFAGYPACWFEDGNEKYEVSVEIKRVTN